MTSDHQEKQTREMIRQNRIASISLGISIIALVVSAVVATLSLRKADKIFELDVNRPIMMVLQKESTGPLVLWNGGKGVAYDVNIETHFADNIGREGAIWISEVVNAALQLETKEQEALYAYRNGIRKELFDNPPPLFPPGTDYGYKTTELKLPVMGGLFLVIKYNDSTGKPYRSVWDGWRWKFESGENNGFIKPVYRDADGLPVIRYAEKLYLAWECQNPSIVHDFDYEFRILDEAAYMEKIGYVGFKDKIKNAVGKLKCPDQKKKQNNLDLFRRE